MFFDEKILRIFLCIHGFPSFKFDSTLHKFKLELKFKNDSFIQNVSFILHYLLFLVVKSTIVSKSSSVVLGIFIFSQQLIRIIVLCPNTKEIIFANISMDM